MSAESASSWRLVAGLVAGVTALRAVLVAKVELGDDEAYYWLWSQTLDWSYFDHPGGVAWAVAASTSVLGDTALAVRLPSLLASAALAALLAWEAPPRARVWVAALGLFVPALGLIGVFAAPDALFLLAWLATALLARRLVAEASVGAWALVGLGVGATLLLKVTGVLLAGGLVTWSLASPDRRAWWRTPGPWVAIAVMALAACPTLAWNLVHDWPTVRFHAVGRHTHGVDFWMGGGTWLAVHLVLLTPPLIWAIVRGARGEDHFWVWVSLPCWVVFTVAAFCVPTKVHWWAPAWVTLLPLAGRVFADRVRVALPTVLVLAAIHGAVLVLAVAPPAPLAPATAELRGWSDLARALSHDHPDATAWVTPRYQLSSQLAWGARHLDAPPVRRVGGRSDQFTMWGADDVPDRGPVVLVCASHLPCTPDTFPMLECVAPKTTRPVHHDSGRVLRTFTSWVCTPDR